MLRLYKKYSEEIKKSVKVGVILLLTYLSVKTISSDTSVNIDKPISLKGALSKYIEDFDNQYITKSLQSDLVDMITNASDVWVSDKSSRVYPTAEGGYRIEVANSLFKTKTLDHTIAIQHLENNKIDLVLVATLVHENQHLKDFDKDYIKGLYKQGGEHIIENLVSGVLAEYFAYKREFELLKDWHDRLNTPLPSCETYKNRDWFSVSTNNLTPEQYGLGMATLIFYTFILPSTAELKAYSEKEQKNLKHVVIKKVDETGGVQNSVSA